MSEAIGRAASKCGNDDRLVGLIAGWGRYPILVAEALKSSGQKVFCLGIKDHADPLLRTLCDGFAWTGLAKIGRSIRLLRRNGCRNATMAGKIHKVRLYQPWAWIKHLPDWRGVRTFYPHFVSRTKDRRDDTLLSAIVDAFAADGIAFNPATDYAPELLVKEGQLTRLSPTAAQSKDIAFGWNLAKEMGRLDIGQCVVVKNQTVIAVEAIEGTDECIRRAGNLCRAGGFSVIKTAKPQQDMRFDVPTVGVWTLASMAAGGGKVLAIEAGRTILVDEPEFIRFANEHRIAVVALNDALGLAAA
jgi:UDP-2,3-diacylglucosamine hydrolase